MLSRDYVCPFVRRSRNPDPRSRVPVFAGLLLGVALWRRGIRCSLIVLVSSIMSHPTEGRHGLASRLAALLLPYAHAHGSERARIASHHNSDSIVAPALTRESISGIATSRDASEGDSRQRPSAGACARCDVSVPACVRASESQSDRSAHGPALKPVSQISLFVAHPNIAQPCQSAASAFDGSAATGTLIVSAYASAHVAPAAGPMAAGCSPHKGRGVQLLHPPDPVLPPKHWVATASVAPGLTRCLPSSYPNLDPNLPDEVAPEGQRPGMHLTAPETPATCDLLREVTPEGPTIYISPRDPLFPPLETPATRDPLREVTPGGQTIYISSRDPLLPPLEIPVTCHPLGEATAEGQTPYIYPPYPPLTSPETPATHDPLGEVIQQRGR